MEKHTIHPDNMRVYSLFESGHSLACEFLAALDWPWEALPLIASYVRELGAKLDLYEYDARADNVWIHKSAVIAPSAFIGSDIIIIKCQP